MNIECATVNDGTDCRVGRIFAGTGAETIQIENHFEFIETIVDAVVGIGSETACEELTIGAPLLIPTAFEQHTKVRFDAGAERPRFIGGFDHHSVARPISEIGQLCGRCSGLFLQLDLLRF